MAAKDDLGRRGENIACRWLTSHGYAILARNWRCPIGEIDIVATIGVELVVAEVKTRSSMRMGHPAEAVTPAKLARLRKLTASWLGANDFHCQAVRIDVIAVLLEQGRVPRVDHRKAVAA